MPLNFLPAAAGRHGIAFLLAVGLALTGQANELADRHRELVKTQGAALAASRAGQAEVYFLGAGLSSKQDVFKHDVQSLRDLLEKHWGSAGRSLSLVADKSSQEAIPFPSRENLREAARAIAKKINPEKDVLVLFLSSHGYAPQSGSPRGLEVALPGEKAFAFSPVDLRKLLDESAAKWRIVILSACYAGGMMQEIRDDHTIVLAAAHTTRASFGCTFSESHTWFTQALLDGLASTTRIEDAFEQARRLIEQKELEGTAYEASLPQIHVGAALRQKMTELEPQLTSAKQWQAPVEGTRLGNMRRLLGSYAGIAPVADGRSTVYWLELSLPAAPAEGDAVIPVRAFLHRFYVQAGQAGTLSFDQQKRTLTGNIERVGRFDLTVGEQEISGTFTPDSTASVPLRLTLAKRTYQQVFELAAAHPAEHLRAKPESKIRLFYFSARDCVYCDKWERDHLTSGRLFGMPESAHVEFVKISRFTLKDKVKRGDFPEALVGFFDRLDTTPAQRRALTIAPSFVVTVDEGVRSVRLGAFGDAPIYPMLRAAVKEKLGQ